MKRSFYSLRMTLSFPRLLPHLLIFLLHSNNDIVKKDLSRWAEIHYLNLPKNLKDYIFLLICFLTFTPEYRNLFYLRFGIFSKLFSWMCLPLASLEIDCKDIGAGFFIQHGISTLISANSIGVNFWVNQQVTIGYSNRIDCPTIGNNVRICPGAKIIGKISIGDNATIGANTVVIDNVSPNATVFGIPGKVIWRAIPPSKEQAKLTGDLVNTECFNPISVP